MVGTLFVRRMGGVVLVASCATCGLSIVGEGALVTPTDGGSMTDASAQLDSTSRDAAPPLVARLNINGPEHVGVDHPGTWTASPVPDGGCGPFAYAATLPLPNTNDAPLFSGEAFGDPLVCAVGSGLAAGTYRAALYFAEVYFGPECPGGGGAGSRVFDVYLEEVKVLTDFDVFRESGGCLAMGGHPIVRAFDVVIDDGQLDIRMPASANNATVTAIELFGPY